MSIIYVCRMCSETCLGQPAVDQSLLAFIERWLHYRGRLHCYSAALVLFGAREAGCFREVAALYSDHYSQVPLYHALHQSSNSRTLQWHKDLCSTCLPPVTLWTLLSKFLKMENWWRWTFSKSMHNCWEWFLCWNRRPFGCRFARAANCSWQTTREGFPIYWMMCLFVAIGWKWTMCPARASLTFQMLHRLRYLLPKVATQQSLGPSFLDIMPASQR